MTPRWTDLRVGVVGTGAFGTSHVTAYQALGVRVRAVVDPDQAAAGRVAAAHGVPAVYPDTADLLAAGEVDAVSVCTPAGSHRPVAELLIGAGVGVLVEKPLAETSRDAQAIADAAEEAGVVCQPGHILRFCPPYRMLHDAVRAGELGDLLAVSCRRDRPRTLSRLFPHAHPALLTAVHDIDLAVWYAGSPVVETRATARRRPGTDAPCLVWGELRHANGVVSGIRNSYLLPEDAANHTRDLTEVYGTDGVAHVDLDQPTLAIQAGRTTTPDSVLSPESGGGALTEELRHFLTRVSGEASAATVTAADGVHAVAVAESLIDSARHDGEVRRVGA